MVLQSIPIVVRARRRLPFGIRHRKQIPVLVIGKSRECLPSIRNLGDPIEVIVAKLRDEPAGVGNTDEPSHCIIGPLRGVAERVGGHEQVAIRVIRKCGGRFCEDWPLDGKGLTETIIASRCRLVVRIRRGEQVSVSGVIGERGLQEIRWIQEPSDFFDLLQF